MDKPISPYAGSTVNPLTLAELAPKAVDRIGEAAALEMEQAADALEAETKQKTDQLRAFALAIRRESRVANASLTTFCERSALVIKTMQDLEDQLNGRETGSKPVSPAASPADTQEPIPTFLQAPLPENR